MAEDIRIKVGFPSHVKTKYLITLGGREASWSLLCLWAYAGANKPHGDLTGMADGMIESAADWPGGPGELIDMLLKCGFLDGEVGSRKLHDWDEHQPWLVGEQDRRESAQWAGLVSRYGEAKATEILAKRRRTARQRAVNDPSTQGRLPVDEASDAPSTPSPSPSPLPIPYQAVVDLFNTTMTKIPKVKLLTPSRRKLIKLACDAAPADRCKPEFWAAYFEECEGDKFLNGTGPYSNGHERWTPTFDFLLKLDVITKTYERAMHRLEQTAH